MSTFHGIRVIETSDQLAAVPEQSTAVIGLVATAGAAVGEPKTKLDLAFPIDTPVLVTDARAAIAVAGTTGTLHKALAAIADQGSPLVIVVRVAEGADADATEANVVGGDTGGYRGVAALLVAQQRLGIRPRILGAPGLDSQAVANALASVAEELRGMVYAAARPEATQVATLTAAITYRAEFGQRELMLIWPDFVGWDGHAVAVALGTRAMLDTKVGYHKSLSNVAVDGVTGLTHDVTFDIRSGANDAAVLNSAQVTTLVRMNGYRFWGNRTCSADPKFAFEVAVRTAQVIGDAIADTNAQMIDKPMTVGTMRSIVEGTNARLAREAVLGRLIGAECSYDPTKNDPAALAAGQLAIDFDFTPVAPLEGLTINQVITDRYYLSFADRAAG